MGVREFRASFGAAQDQPIAVTRHGWIVGVYYPYNDPVHPPPEVLGAIINADPKTPEPVKAAALRTLAVPSLEAYQEVGATPRHGFNSRPFTPAPKTKGR